MNHIKLIKVITVHVLINIFYNFIFFVDAQLYIR